MIRLQRSLVEGLKSSIPEILLQAVRQALQQAVMLEHSTIPVYLYGLYSLDESKNGAIAEILQSVVVEEMLHMTLAANVLNALGGSPTIDTPDFIPTYPGNLPGSVESSLVVHLRPFSQDQLMTFLQIEQPAKAIDIPSDAQSTDDGITIGQFYDALAAAITVLGVINPKAFVNPARNQVGPDLMWGSVIVTDAASARKAIATIVEQGEGSKVSPDESTDGPPAHYYRFMQIYAGAMLQAAPGKTPPWAYSGAPVLMDVEGIYPVPNDPKAANYPLGSAQALANDMFNYTYTSLLKALHALFNGQNSQDQLNVAIGLMMSLKGQAKAMMAGIPNPSAPYTGPSFEYKPVLPAR